MISLNGDLINSHTYQNSISRCGFYGNKTYAFCVISAKCCNGRNVSELRRTLELALLREAYGYGIREVLLCGVAILDADALYSYVLELKSSAPELAVGIALPADVLLADSVFCAKLADIFDYIAVDLTSEFSSVVADYTSTPSAHDTETNDENVTEGEQNNNVTDPIADSIKRAARIFLRFGAKAYIDIGDGCAYCTETASNKLKASGVDSFVLSVSKSHHG